MVDRDGSVIARERVPHPTMHPADGAAEQDPWEWWEHTLQIIARVTADTQGDVSLSAISVTGQMHGLVLRDGAGDPAGNAIIWQDRRSASTLPTLFERLPAAHPARNQQPIEPGYQVASWHWLCKSDPELALQTGRISSPKDELIYRLTGRHVTEQSDAIGAGLFDASTSRWDPKVAAAANIPLDRLPAIIRSGDVAGTVQPHVADELGLEFDVPVVIAGGDAAVAAFGAGIVQPSQPLLMLSSGCQVLQSCGDRCASPSSGTSIWPSANPPGLPRWLQVGTTRNGGNAIDWAHRVFTSASLEDELDDVSPSDARPPLFIPYLDGERAPVSASAAPGEFIGLSSHHDADVMIKAVTDGVTLGVADVHVRMGGDIGTATPLRVGGGGVRNRQWLNAISRIFSRPLDVISEPDLSAWGAARSAAATLGWIDPVRDPDSWLPPMKRITHQLRDPVSARRRLESFRRIAGTMASLCGNLPE